MLSHFLLAPPFPALSLHPLPHLAQVLEAVGEAAEAAGARVSGRERLDAIPAAYCVGL